MATIDTATAALRRARKRLAHAVAQGEAAPTERARLRHERKANNARRLLKEAGRMWEGFALEAAPD